MSVVTPQWLELREPADAAARSEELAERLARHLPEGPLTIHDLGGGSGAMGRWLAPRLPGPQHWVVHDRDEGLLELAATSFETRRSDITRLAPDELAGASVVTASALLDMLTADELARMLGACAGLPMLIAMTVTGGVTLTPADPLDARLAAAFNAHQRRDGRLGPDAVAAAAEQLGGEVLVRPSPWRLDAAHGELMTEWLGGWIAAACEQDPRAGCRAPTGTGGSRRRRPGSSPSPWTMPTCWRCRDHRRPPRRCRRDARRPGVAARHGPVPRRPARRRRRGAGGRVRARRPDHRVLRLALEGRGPRPRRRAAAGHGGGRVLPLDLPQRHAARRRAGRRAPRRHGHGLRAVVWERSAGQVVQVVLTVAVLLVLASPVRPVMPFVALGLLAAARLAIRSRWRIGGSRLRGARTRPPRRAARPAGVAGHRTRVGAGRRRPRGHVPDRRANRGGDRADVRSCCRWRCSCCWSPRCPTSVAGGRARARRPGRSPPPAWARRSGSPPRSCTA